MIRDHVTYDRERKGWIARCHGVRSSLHQSESGALRTYQLFVKILGVDQGKI